MGNVRSKITRRRFLQLVVGGVGGLSIGISPASGLISEATYRVGIGNLSDPYEATLRAVEATGEWPASLISGRSVGIKPNLVTPVSSDTGVTTDPEVVRALVDLALWSGAQQVLIVEGGFGGANFSACGYDFFNSYDLRVKFVDLNDEPLTFVEAPGGSAYAWMFIPELLLSEDVVFISAAKLKTHFITYATLAMKNLIGLAPIDKYSYPLVNRLGALHYRGINQVVTDLNLIRSIDYGVVDGIWAMEGQGPAQGDPVRMNVVVAGRNPVAVDRVCLWAMVFPQGVAWHLSYAARKGLGPADLTGIEILGGPLTQRPFKWPTNLPPIVEYPRAIPHWFTPGAGQQVWIVYWVPLPCLIRVEIVRTSELSPEITHVRTLHDWESRLSGFQSLRWDGRDDAGEVVAPSLYAIWVQAKYSDQSRSAYAMGWVWVKDS